MADIPFTQFYKNNTAAKQSPAFIDNEITKKVGDIPPEIRTVVSSNQNINNSSLKNIIHIGQPGSIFLGKVLASFPYYDLFKVAIQKPAKTILCTTLKKSGLFKQREITSYPTGTTVLVYIDQFLPVGIIIGEVPYTSDHPAGLFPDRIEQSGVTGHAGSEIYNTILDPQIEELGFVKFSCGKPLDASGLGEWGMLNDAGIGFLLDNFHFSLRIDETTGIFGTFLDRWLKVAAYNFTEESSSHERHIREVNDTLYDYEGAAYRLWEALGSRIKQSIEDLRRQEIEDPTQLQPPYSVFEPQYDDQLPFYRLEIYRGQAGRGQRKHIKTFTSSADYIRRQATIKAKDEVGLLRVTEDYSGNYIVESAQGIFHIKVPVVPIPLQKKQPEEQFLEKPNATPNDFVAPHTIPTDNHLHLAASAKNLFSYLANIFCPGTFAEDNKVFETQDLATLSKEIFPKREFKEKPQEIEPPEPIEIPLEEDEKGEKKTVKLYPTLAGTCILPDGSVCITDGYGSAIILSRGNIYIAPAKNLYFLPRKNCNIFAGNDIILNAKDSVDITTAQHDIRLKAEKNMELMSGNSGKGRLLLENRSIGFDHPQDHNTIGEDIENKGVFIVSRQSDICVNGGQIYLRTGSPENNFYPGRIVVDADKGRGFVNISAAVLEKTLSNSEITSFATAEQAAAGQRDGYVMTFPTAIMTSGGLIAQKDLTSLQGGIYCAGWIMSKEAHIATKLADMYQGYVATLKDQSYADIVNYFEEAQFNIENSLAAISVVTDIWQTIREEPYVGSNTVQQTAQMSLRNERQYETEDWTLPEMPWQTQLRLKKLGQTWKEPTVMYTSQVLRPYPGNDRRAATSFITINGMVYNEEDNAPNTRANIAELYQAEYSVFDNSYII